MDIFVSPSVMFGRLNEAGRRSRPCVFGVDYALERAFFLDEPADSSVVWWEVEGSGNVPSEPIPLPPLSAVPPSRDDYARSFDVVRQGLLRGDSFLANLTMPSLVSEPPDFGDVSRSCGGRYKFRIADEFVCFSPEPFVCISGGGIAAFPMKGTAPDAPGAEEALLADYKEACEHNTIVDLLRNDLAMVARGVGVERFRYVERVATPRGALLQTSSEIRGTLPDGWQASLGDIIRRLLPAGSICGAPKEATCGIIARAETASRGWYTGVAGYFDGFSLRSGVMIRCLQRTPDGRVWFHSGGGVTVNSSCDDEYSELIEKICLPSLCS